MDESTYKIIKEIVNLVYLLSAPAVAIIMYIGLKQLKLLKNANALSLNNNTIKQCQLFRSEIQSDFEKIRLYLNEKGLPEYNGFKPEVLKAEFTIAEVKSDTKWHDKYIEIRKNDRKFNDNANIFKDFNNKMDLFSGMVLNGVIDKELARNFIRHDFIRFVEGLAPIISIPRKNKNN